MKRRRQHKRTRKLRVTNFEYLGTFELREPPALWQGGPTCGRGFSMGSDWGCRAHIAGVGDVEIWIRQGEWTDLASFPVFFRRMLNRLGPNKVASPIHDAGYRTGMLLLNGAMAHCAQEIFDALYLAGMLESGESKMTAKIIWTGLRLGGWWQWRKYRKLDQATA